MIIKHANPCGAAIGVDAHEAYLKAFKTDPKSAFGGIIAFNREVDGATASEVVKQFAEVVIAPSESDLKVVTKKQPTSAQIADMMFAWNIARFVKSNTIVYAHNGMTLGVGAGQMSRVDSARIAAIKAQESGLSLAGSAAASDAFFPFRDGLDVIVDQGATCVIQPGGSIRDDEVIAAADERGIVMVFTGERHFRH